MSSYVLHPMFAGEVVRVDPLPAIRRQASGFEFEAAKQSVTVSPLSTLSADEVASVIARIQSAGGSLEDSEAPFLR